MHRLVFVRESWSAGLVGGAAVGLLLSLVIGWTRRDLLTPGNALDMLSYSTLAHALLAAVHGAVVGALAAGVSAMRGGKASGSGRVALAALVAGVGAFTLWPAAWHAGVSLAFGVNARWLVAVAVCWAALFGGTAVAVGWIGRIAEEPARRWLRLAVAPTLVVLFCCALAQWSGRPKLRAAPVPLPRSTIDRPAAALPNIVLIVLDTQRADRLGAYGYDRPTSPHLDAFADDAALWEHCLSPAIWTLPAHASMFTGLHPSEHGADATRRWLDDDFDTLAERLGRRGYETVAVSNNLWVSAVSNLTQGFDRVLEPYRLHHARGNTISEFLDKALYPASLVGPLLGRLTSEDAGGEFANRLIDRWLGRRDPSQPFFLFVNYMEPHEPYRPHRAHRRPFLEGSRLTDSYRPTFNRANEFSLLGLDTYETDELRLLGDLYDAETRLVDDHFGGLIASLSRYIELDDTLVLVTADHGENLGDHHMQGHTNCVYDTLARVPLIVRYPRRVVPGRRDDLVQTTDLLPTILDALGDDPGPARSLLREPVDRDRVAIVERMAPQTTLAVPDPSFDDRPYRVVMRAVRQGRWKLIRGAGGREELYDVVRDPGEIANRVADRPEDAERLRRALDAWLAASQRYTERAADEVRPMNDATRRRLRALGYLE